MDKTENTKKRKADRICFVPGCTSRSKSNKTKITLFCTPKDKIQFEKWSKMIPRSDKDLDEYSVVCELHFDERFIERNYKYIIEGKKVLLPRTKPVLTADAFPSVFPSLPKYFTKNLPPKRSPKIRDAAPPPPKKRNKSFECSIPTPASDNEDYSNNAALRVLDSIPLPSKWCKISKSQEELFLYASYDHFSLDVDIKKMMNTLSSPSKLIVVHIKDQTFSCSIYINYKLIKTVEANSSTEVETILKYTETLIPCSGAGSITEFPAAEHSKSFDTNNGIFRSKNCQGYVFSRAQCCIHCKFSRKRLLNIKSKAKTLKKKRLENMKKFTHKVKLC